MFDDAECLAICTAVLIDPREFWTREERIHRKKITVDVTAVHSQRVGALSFAVKSPRFLDGRSPAATLIHISGKDIFCIKRFHDLPRI